MSTQESFYDQVIELARAKGCRFRNGDSELTILEWLWNVHRIHVFTRTNEGRGNSFKFQYAFDDESDRSPKLQQTRSEELFVQNWEALVHGLRKAIEHIE